MVPLKSIHTLVETHSHSPYSLTWGIHMYMYIMCSTSRGGVPVLVSSVLWSGVAEPWHWPHSSHDANSEPTEGESHKGRRQGDQTTIPPQSCVSLRSSDPFPFSFFVSDFCRGERV